MQPVIVELAVGAAMPDADAIGTRRDAIEHRLRNQLIVGDDLGGLEQLGGAQREQLRVAGPRAYEGDEAAPISRAGGTELIEAEAHPRLDAAGLRWYAPHAGTGIALEERLEHELVAQLSRMARAAHAVLLVGDGAPGKQKNRVVC